MIHRPKLKDHFHSEVVEPDTVFLLTEDAQWILNGRVYRALMPHLDGTRTADQLVQDLASSISAPEIYATLTQLEKRDYIVEADGVPSSGETAFWHALDVDTLTAQHRLQATPLRVVAVGNADPEPLVKALQTTQVVLAEDGPWQVVVTDDYLQVDLEELNRQALAAGRPWVLVKLVGTLIWVGPIFHPGRTACWECVAQRLRANQQLQTYVLRKLGRRAPLVTSVGALPTTIQTGAHLAAIEILKWVLLGQHPGLETTLLTFNTITGEMQRHGVVRRPQCPACGDPEAFRQPKALRLSSRPKVSADSTGHRGRSADETLAGYEHSFSPITGVVTWLADLTGDHNGLAYSYGAGHNFAMIQDNLYWLKQNLRSRTGGKGMTETQAKVSAIGEAIERYSAVYRREEAVVRGSYRSLSPDAIHMNDLLGFSEAQYRERQTWNRRPAGDPFHAVPNPFDEDCELDWAPVWSLTHQCFKYVPASFCYFGHPESNSPFFCAGDSNGTAAGNSLEEAILQAFLELVERDSVAMWWYNRVQRPRVDLDSFRNPYFDALRAYYAGLGRELWVVDITSDLNIPVFAAVSRRTDRPVEDITLGFGAHLDPQVGLLRAIAELNQFLPAVHQQKPDGSTLYSFPDGGAIDWWKTATVLNQPYVVPDPNAPRRRQTDYVSLASPDLLTEIQTCVSIARAAGLETLALDLTRPDAGMNVCRVTAPGLRHFWRRLGPGRLYDVPVKLGWLDQATPEEAMNPISIFF